MDRLGTHPSASSAPTLSPGISAVCEQFSLRGTVVAALPHGNGHINDTFAVTSREGGNSVRYILQRINQRVFTDVPALMENISRVTAHVAGRTAGLPPAERRRSQTLTIVPTRSGDVFHRDASGDCWRCYDFIERARTYDILENPAQARAAARAFGRFQELLADLPPPRLHETIRDFHHTRRRFETLLEAVATDPHGRAANVADEIAFARAREPLVDRLLDLQRNGGIPERITHNDTKLNNVMLDDATGDGVGVIDLDTVMPGLALYDFGDLVRSASNSAAEDETDLSRVAMNLPVFTAVAEGYLASARRFLNDAEKAHLVHSAKLLTFEVGIRFLTDFLLGDVYFKTKRAGHNLDRCRCQFALLRSMEAQTAEMENIVRKLDA